MEKYKDNKLNEIIYYDTSNNGIPVYYIPKKGYQEKFAAFTTNYGSLDNIFKPVGSDDYIEVPEGVAHFLEHKLFEDPNKEIFEQFSELGADVNAFTSHNQTSYVFNTSERFYESLRLLINFVQNPYFTEENIEKEKGIIDQEINMYKDMPNWELMANTLNNLYKKHPIKIDIAGTNDSIKKINKEVLDICYNTFYHPSNMVLTISGDLDFNTIMDVVNEYEKQFKIKDIKIDRLKENEPKSIARDKYIQHMEVPIPMFQIAFKDTDLRSDNKYNIKKAFITNIMLDIILGASSDFYYKMYNEGLVDLNFTAYYRGDLTYGHTVISGQSEDVDEVYKKIKEYISKSSCDIITKKNFRRMKKNMLGKIILAHNNIEYNALGLAEYHFKNFNFLNLYKVVDSISYEEVVDRFENHIQKNETSISIIKS